MVCSNFVVMSSFSFPPIRLQIAHMSFCCAFSVDGAILPSDQAPVRSSGADDNYLGKGKFIKFAPML